MATQLQPGDILPGRDLERLEGGRVRVGANGPRAQVLIVTHAQPCHECSRYLDSFDDAVMASIRDEKADVIALVGGGRPHHASPRVPAVVVDEPTLDALSPERTPVVAIVDRFGQLFRRVDAGPDHSFPHHQQVLYRLLDIAIRCPECGVPDVPSPDVLPEEGTRSGGMMLAQ